MVKKNGVVSFDSKKNANIICKYFSNLAELLLQKILHPKNKFEIKTAKEYYENIWNECGNFFCVM